MGSANAAWSAIFVLIERTALFTASLKNMVASGEAFNNRTTAARTHRCAWDAIEIGASRDGETGGATKYEVCPDDQEQGARRALVV